MYLLTRILAYSKIVQAWDRSLDPVRCFSGCGSAWLPSLSSGAQFLDVELWKPCHKGFHFPGGITARLPYIHKRMVLCVNVNVFFTVDNLLPVSPDLRSIRELSISPYLRSQIQVVSNLFCLLSFHSFRPHLIKKAEAVGCVQLQMNTVVIGMEEKGIRL